MAGRAPNVGASDPAVDGGGTGGSTAAAGSEPPGLRRSQAGHPSTRRPYPRTHRQRFRSVGLGDNGRPFVMAQQLRDACRKWLMAEDRNVEAVVDLVVLEQFIARLPWTTAEWVQCHRPTSLTQAIQLAEDHLVACPGVGEPLINLSLSPTPLLPCPLSLALFRLPGRVATRPLEPHSGEVSSRGTGLDARGAWPRALEPSLYRHPPHLSANLLALLLPLGWREGLGRSAGDAGTRVIFRTGVL